MLFFLFLAHLGVVLRDELLKCSRVARQFAFRQTKDVFANTHDSRLLVAVPQQITFSASVSELYFVLIVVSYFSSFYSAFYFFLIR